MDSVIFILHDRQPRKRNPKLLSYTSKVFFNILISKLRKIKKLFVELKQGTLKKVSSGRTSDNMIRGKKALINTVGTRIQKRKLGAATHQQASVAEEELLSQGKKDDLPREWTIIQCILIENLCRIANLLLRETRRWKNGRPVLTQMGFQT